MPRRTRERRNTKSGAARYRLLVVDDDEAILASFRRYFTPRGFRVECAREAEEGKALLSHRNYDVVVVDLHLTTYGGVEGLDIIHHLRRRGPATRVILFTGNQSPEVEREALRRGADLVLLKPTSLIDVERFALALLGDRRE